jgi:hypothetical protein
MRITLLHKLGMAALLIGGLALPCMANTLPSSQFSPDRDARFHRDSSDDVQSIDSQVSGGNLFRPSRHSSFDLLQDDDVVIPNTNDLDAPNANNPPPPDAPTEPVPEPGTVLLMAPATLGLWTKFRR